MVSNLMTLDVTNVLNALELSKFEGGRLERFVILAASIWTAPTL